MVESREPRKLMVPLPAPQIISLFSRRSLLSYFFTILSYTPSSFSFISKGLKIFYVEEKIRIFIYRLSDEANSLYVGANRKNPNRIYNPYYFFFFVKLVIFRQSASLIVVEGKAVLTVGRYKVQINISNKCRSIRRMLSKCAY